MNLDLKKKQEKYWHIRKPTKPNLKFHCNPKILIFLGISIFWWYISIGTMYLIVDTMAPFERGWYGIGATFMVIVLVMSLIMVPIILYSEMKK